MLLKFALCRMKISSFAHNSKVMIITKGRFSLVLRTHNKVIFRAAHLIEEANLFFHCSDKYLSLQATWLKMKIVEFLLIINVNHVNNIKSKM